MNRNQNRAAAIGKTIPLNLLSNNLKQRYLKKEKEKILKIQIVKCVILKLNESDES